mgnify:CR=1 FL=1
MCSRSFILKAKINNAGANAGFFSNNLLQLPPPFVTGFNHTFPFDFPILLCNKSPGSGLKITTHFCIGSSG